MNIRGPWSSLSRMMLVDMKWERFKGKLNAYNYIETLHVITHSTIPVLDFKLNLSYRCSVHNHFLPQTLNKVIGMLATAMVTGEGFTGKYFYHGTLQILGEWKKCFSELFLSSFDGEMEPMLLLFICDHFAPQW